jgi:hypothetical protein
VYYCNRECQKNDWPSHKVACRQLKAASVNRTDGSGAGRSEADGEESAAGEDCTICLNVMLNSDKQALSCCHQFHRQCLAKMAQKGLKQVCPLCRAPQSKAEDLEERRKLLYFRAEQTADQAQRESLHQEAKKLGGIDLGTQVPNPAGPLHFELANAKNADGEDQLPDFGFSFDQTCSMVETNWLREFIPAHHDSTHCASWYVNTDAIKATAHASYGHTLVSSNLKKAQEAAACALDLFSHCIEAHNVLARCSTSLDKALKHYTDAFSAAPLCIGGSHQRFSETKCYW